MKINKRGGPNKVRRGGGKRSKLISGWGGGERGRLFGTREYLLTVSFQEPPVRHSNTKDSLLPSLCI